MSILKKLLAAVFVVATYVPLLILLATYILVHLMFLIVMFWTIKVCVWAGFKWLEREYTEIYYGVTKKRAERVD